MEGIIAFPPDKGFISRNSRICPIHDLAPPARLPTDFHHGFHGLRPIHDRDPLAYGRTCVSIGIKLRRGGGEKRTFEIRLEVLAKPIHQRFIMESTRKKLDLDQIGQKIMDFFTSEQLAELAQETKFVQRRSRMSGALFVQALVFGFMEKPRASLAQLAQVVADLHTWISPQGLDERINARSVRFLQAVFAKAMQIFRNQIPLELPFLQQFTRILIVDSSIQALPDQMQDTYPGCGGGGAPSSLKIQLVFEFLYGNFEQIVLQPGRSADQSYRAYLEFVPAHALILFDLGYYCLETFQTLAARSAYFLSRYLYPTALFTPQGEPIQLLSSLRATSQPTVEKEVRLGRRHHLPCRLISIRVPPAVAEERRRKAREKARQHGKTLTQEYSALLEWSLFLTNVPAPCLSVQQVALLYRLRWQIELIFKLWKSYAGWKAIGMWRKERILSELYAKLIGIVLFQFLVAPVRIPDPVWDHREVSHFKAHAILARFAPRLVQALPDAVAFCRLIDALMAYFTRFALKQKRVNNPNVCQSLASALA